MNHFEILGLLLIIFFLINKFFISKKIFIDPKHNSYHKSFTVSKDNNEKFSILLFNFLNNNNINLSKLNNILVNQGPGKFSVIRTSIAVAKALSLTNQLNLYGFNAEDLINDDYNSIINLYKKGKLTKNLINPVYSS